MARIDVGNELSDYIVTPGWKISDDGYGLRTATIQFTTNVSNGIDFVRGEVCPISGYEYLFLHKQTSVMGAGGIQIQTCDYVGIAPDVNEGVTTNPQVSTSNGLTSENITSNPNFFTSGGDGYVGIIAGTSYTQSPIGPLVEIKNVADYVTVIVGYNSDGTAVTALSSKKQSYIGENGACFESENGGRFIGFVDPSFKNLYGKTNYLSPQSTFSGQFYTSDQTEVQNMIHYLGTTSYDNDWAGTMPKIVPEYAGTSWHSEDDYDQLLLSQVNIEDYGALYKVIYEVRYSLAGWHDAVYRKSSVMP